MLGFGAQEIIGNRYLIDSQLGKGGMGAVFRATDKLSKKEVALKRVYVPPERLRHGSFSNATNDFDLMLAQEFKTLATLRHPHVISVLDYGFEENRQPYFTMDLLNQPQTLYRAAWGQPEAVKIKYLLQILQALVYCHRRGVIHRDLKPENIMVIFNTVKVLDFGLAVISDEIDQLPADEIAGTLQYIAPELFRGAPPSVPSDLYAVGLIAYEMFAEKYLYRGGNTKQIVTAILTASPDMNAIQNQDIAYVLQILLSKFPDQRYSSAEQVIQALCDVTGYPLPQETMAIRESFLQSATLVGRDQELEYLSARLQDVANTRQHHELLIGGESGVGKTRLIEELRTRALVSGMLVLRGESVAVGAAPYQPWRNPLRWLALLANLNDEDAAILKALVPDISMLLERDIPDAPEVNPQFGQERLLMVLEKVFSTIKQPTLIILEDMHWAGAENFNLLNRMYPLFEQLPVFIVATYRDDERPDLLQHLPYMEVMRLSRLNREEVGELSAAMLGEAGRNPNLQALLQRETEGNVFFLVEVMRALAEDAGNLSQISIMELPERVFTGGVEQIIQRRLTRIPQDALDTLRLAATIGRQIDFKLMDTILGDEINFEDWLLICSNAAILEVRDEAWQFTHDKIRDGALKNLELKESQELHRQVATAIEDVYLNAPQYTNLLVYHWAQAGNLEKEEDYAALAGRQSLSSGAYEEAVRHLERALDLNQQHAPPDKKQATQTYQLGQAYFGLSNYSAARQCYEQSLQISQQFRYGWGEASALNELGNLAFTEGDYAAAEQYFLDALEVAAQYRAQAAQVGSLVGLAHLLSQQGRKSEAASLAVMSAEHPSADRSTTDRASSLLNQLADDLAPAEFEEARQTGQHKKLREVVNEILGNTNS